jgi:nicotinamidase-related amidase
MKPALLVIDVQKKFLGLDPVMTQSINDAIEVINAVIELFREHDLPVISIQHVDEEGGLVPGEAGFDTPESLNVLPSDLHIHKTYGNSFTKTSLADELHKQSVDTVIVTGFCAEHCVLSAYRGAQDHDLMPILLRGALASDNLENIGFVERISEIISFEALKKVLG